MKDTLFFSLAMMAERMVSFFLLPILTKIVTPAEYAIWSQSVLVTGMMVPVVLLGFQTAVVKFFPLWINQKKERNSVILFMLISVLILFFLISVATLMFDEKVAKLIFGDSQMFLYIPLLVGLLFSEVFFELLVGVLRVTDRMRKVSIYLLMKGVWRIGVLLLVLIRLTTFEFISIWSLVVILPRCRLL